MRSYLIHLLTFGILLLNLPGFGQLPFQTIAEQSGFQSTANYEEVMANIASLKKMSGDIRVETIARSTEGRDIPLLVIGHPLPKSPAAMLSDDRIVVYVQANIHAGEVEGKEASLMFARDLLSGKNPDVLRNVIFLICPLFNTDGNQKISPANRTHQNGPVNGVGVRYNGQFLDLNRDAMKAESPEIKGVITHVFNKWDPSVFMDCHTTNGSYHIEPVTFTWMVNPNGDHDLISYMRDKMMPAMANTLRQKYQTENCFYGEFDDMLKPEKGWMYDAAEPRYMTNYVGLRNRLSILDENYVYSDYKSRVLGCYHLIRSLADYCVANKTEIRKLVREADKKSMERGANPALQDSLAVEYAVRAIAEPATIQTYEAELVGEVNGWKNYRKTDRRKTVTIPYFIDYYATKSVKFPFAYLLTAPDATILELLQTHGIHLERLSKERKLEVERFDITELKGATRLNQGHYTNTIKGKPVLESLLFPTGTVLIRTAQPLANVAAYLLEPLSNDGLVVWNFLDRYLVPQWGAGFNTFPVFKVLNREEIASIPY